MDITVQYEAPADPAFVIVGSTALWGREQPELPEVATVLLVRPTDGGASLDGLPDLVGGTTASPKGSVTLAASRVPGAGSFGSRLLQLVSLSIDKVDAPLTLTTVGGMNTLDLPSNGPGGALVLGTGTISGNTVSLSSAGVLNGFGVVSAFPDQPAPVWNGVSTSTTGCVGVGVSAGFPTINTLGGSSCITQDLKTYLLSFGRPLSGSWGNTNGGDGVNFQLVSIQNTADSLLASQGLANIEIDDTLEANYGGKRHGIVVKETQSAPPAGLYYSGNVINDLELTAESNSFDNGTATAAGTSFQNLGMQAWLHCTGESTLHCSQFENIVTGQENDVSIERDTSKFTVAGSITLNSAVIPVTSAAGVIARQEIVGLTNQIGLPIFASSATIDSFDTTSVPNTITMSVGAQAPLTVSGPNPQTFLVGGKFQSSAIQRFGGHFVAYGAGSGSSNDAAIEVEATSQPKAIINTADAFADNGAWWSAYSADNQWPINNYFGTFSGYYAGTSAGLWSNPTGYAMWDARNAFTTSPFASPGFSVEQWGAANVDGLRLGTNFNYMGVPKGGQPIGTIDASSIANVIDPQGYVLVSAKPQGLSSGSGYLGNNTCPDSACSVPVKPDPAGVVVLNSNYVDSGVTVSGGGDLLFEPGCRVGSPTTNNVLLLNSDGSQTIAPTSPQPVSRTACAPFTNWNASSSGTFGGFVLQVKSADSPGHVTAVSILVPGYWHGNTAPPGTVYPVGGHGTGVQIQLGWQAVKTLQIAPSGGTLDLSEGTLVQHAATTLAAAGTGCTSNPTLLTGEFNAVSGGGTGYVLLQSVTGTTQRVYNLQTNPITVCPDPNHSIHDGTSTTVYPVGTGVTLAANNTALFVTVNGSLTVRSP